MDIADSKVLEEDTLVRIGSLDYYTIHIWKTFTSEDMKGWKKTYDVVNWTNKIADHAFEDINSIMHVYISASVKEIGEVAFKNTSGLFFDACLEIERIDDLAFKNSRVLMITMHEKLMHTSDRAFKGCTYMTITNLKESSVTEIGSETFVDSGFKIVDLHKITTMDPTRSTGPSSSGKL